MYYVYINIYIHAICNMHMQASPGVKLELSGEDLNQLQSREVIIFPFVFYTEYFFGFVLHAESPNFGILSSLQVRLLLYGKCFEISLANLNLTVISFTLYTKVQTGKVFS